MASITKRTRGDGTSVYRVQVRMKGYPPESATFERITDAKKWEQDTESAMRDGRHFRTAEAKRHTVAEMIDRYRRDVLPTKGNQRLNQGHQLDWWRKEIGPYTLANTPPALIGECRDKLLSEEYRPGRHRSPATVNRYLAALSHVLSVAVREWGWLDDSPMRKVRKPREPRGRVRFLSDDERKRLLAACKESRSPYLYAVVVLALSTGARYGEIMNLTWKDVDRKRGLITIDESKNGERRALPLTGHALELISELAKVRRIDTDLVFPARRGNKPANLQDAWVAALERAKIEDFRFHDLRHSAASYLAMNGASLAELAAVLGHKTLAMVKRYSHLTEQHTINVVTKMNHGLFPGQ